MGEPALSDRLPVRRAPYFFQDPIRAGGLGGALLLMFLEDVPFAVGLLAVGISQANGIAMVIRLIGRGWSREAGGRARASLFTNSLAVDWTNTSICTLVGAMYLMRMFGSGQLVAVMGTLTLAIGLIPDVRFCRILLPRDAREAGGVLERGYFFRDPIKLGALCALVIVCVLDRTSLAFVFVSMVLLQLSPFLVLIDKYSTEVEVGRELDWMPVRLFRLMMARDGQRLLLALLPLGLVPLRLGTNDLIAQWAALTVAVCVVVPDVLRIVGRLIWGLGERAIERAPAKA